MPEAIPVPDQLGPPEAGQVCPFAALRMPTERARRVGGPAHGRRRRSGPARPMGDFARARELTEASLPLLEAAEDHAGAALALHNLGMIGRDQGLAEEAQGHIARSLDLARRAGDRATTAKTLRDLAFLARDRGDADGADAPVAPVVEVGDPYHSRRHTGCRRPTLDRDDPRLAQECLAGADQPVGLVFEHSSAPEPRGYRSVVVHERTHAGSRRGVPRDRGAADRARGTMFLLGQLCRLLGHRLGARAHTFGAPTPSNGAAPASGVNRPRRGRHPPAGLRYPRATSLVWARPDVRASVWTRACAASRSVKSFRSASARRARGVFA
jgi:hypothetical protein